MRDEILEQPAAIERLLTSQAGPIEDIARAVQAADVEYVLIAARGTSDHAAVYAQYVFGTRQRWPVALAAPSVQSLYGAEPRFGRALVIGISQSGASPDVVGVIAAARRQGAPTIAITNDPSSPLAQAAEHGIDLSAGPERAVAATKTYTAELTAVARLSAAMDEDGAAAAEIARLPAAVAEALATEPEAERIARDQAPLGRCVVLGRGYEYATAREWALKLKELGRVFADPYSAADFRHGPMALAEPGIPILAVAPSGAAEADLASLLAGLRDDVGADALVLSDREAARRGARWSLPLPSDVPEWLMPVVSIVPAQLHALHLTIASGLDPDRPRNLRKVTLTT
jgi:glucosamine--fructose-6-phosphate aminotransferase (isomerizing)